jgi:hypothetical protein
VRTGAARRLGTVCGGGAGGAAQASAAVGRRPLVSAASSEGLCGWLRRPRREMCVRSRMCFVRVLTFYTCIQIECCNPYLEFSHILFTMVRPTSRTKFNTELFRIIKSAPATSPHRRPRQATVRDDRGGWFGALSILLLVCKSFFDGVFVWARMALTAKNGGFRPTRQSPRASRLRLWFDSRAGVGHVADHEQVGKPLRAEEVPRHHLRPSKKGVRLAQKLAHAFCGNTSLKGLGWPNFWANLASFSLTPRPVRLCSIGRPRSWAVHEDCTGLSNIFVFLREGPCSQGAS